MTPAERIVVELVAAYTGLDVAAVDPRASFVDLGLDSLSLTQLAQALAGRHGLRLSLRELMREAATPAAVAARLPSTATAPTPASLPQVEGARAPLTGPSADVREVLAAQLRLMQAQLQMLGAGGAALAAPSSPPPAAASAVTLPGAAAAAPTTARPRGGRLTPHQERHLSSLVAAYTARTPGSKAATQRHRFVHADPRTASGFTPLWKEMVYPLHVERSRGARLWDVDGNEYVDLLNGFGPNFLGHGAPPVVEALRAQLEQGFEVGPQHPLAGETAALVCAITGMDRAAFVATGSEAVQAALRAARTHTGRTKVVTFARDYHGNFDEVLVRGMQGSGGYRSVPSAPGIPDEAVAGMIVLEYGTEASLDTIRRLAPELAAVLVEPVQSRRPEFQPREFLHELRAITRASGTVLIFDEIVNGFRIHPRGAQGFFDIEADLATYGKVIGGGLPIGVVAGRRPFMDVFDGGPWAYGDASGPEAGVTFFAGTFVRHPLALAAAHATLRELQRGGTAFYEALHARAARFAADVQGMFAEFGVPFEFPHCQSLFYLRAPSDQPLAGLLFPALRLNGVHMLEGFPAYWTAAHGEAESRWCLDAFRRALTLVVDGTFVRQAADRAATTRPVGAPSSPPVPGARLGRDRDGTPAWFAPDATGAFVRVS